MIVTSGISASWSRSLSGVYRLQSIRAKCLGNDRSFASSEVLDLRLSVVSLGGDEFVRCPQISSEDHPRYQVTSDLDICDARFQRQRGATLHWGSLQEALH